MKSAELQHLLQCLRERNIDYRSEKVVATFESAETVEAATAWVEQYLDASTLLTKEELNFQYAPAASLLPNAKHRQATLSRFPSDEELEAAILSLEASSAAIEKQCEVLESQRRALDELKARNSLNRVPSIERERDQKGFARDRAQLNFENDELTQTLIARLKSATKQADTIIADHPYHVEKLLEKDDRILEGLQKLLPVTSRPIFRENETAETEKLCATLAILQTKEIHARLDALYVQTFAAAISEAESSSESSLSSQQSKRRDTLVADLSELGNEIDGLVAIAIDHQYRKPLQHSQSSLRMELKAQQANWSQFLRTTLQYLTVRLDKTAEQMKTVHAHRAAMRTINGSLSELLTTNRPKSETKDPVVAEKFTVKGLKPLRLVQANISENQDPGAQLIRHFNIRTLELEDLAKAGATMESVLQERKETLSHLAKNTELEIKTAIGRSLDKTEGNMEKLRSSVFAFSEYGSVNLVAPRVQRDLDNFDLDTQRLGDGMRNLDIDGTISAVRTRLAEIAETLKE